MEGYWAVLFPVLKVWFSCVIVLIMLPAMFGISLGITETYMKLLIKTLEWATHRIQRASRAEEILKESASNGLIQRDNSSLEQEIEELRRNRPKSADRGDFTLSDVLYFSRKGFESIVEDDVTQRFTSEELVSWNLLTRTNNNFQYISLRLTVLWVVGVVVRYCILLPLRITLTTIGLTWLVIGTTTVGFLPNCRVKNWLSELVHLMCYRICARGLSATIHFHNKQNRPKKGGICVANHTSPIDVVILANDGCYAMVGQVHGGLMGVLQRAMERSCPHIWFERSEMRDRHLVTQRLKDHVNAKTKLPILIFPEGTCINNTSVMMFKKGSFEIGGTIYPVAIKYDPQFGDAFWNSSKYSIMSYLLRMMTSWAIVCNVWYLPPMTHEEGEDAVQFANRVKSTIAQQGGLVDLAWDGGLKRAKVKDSFKEQQQKKYSHMVVGEDSSD
ncbi:glycerol-3-phosphate acyltransferase 3-like [Danio rerio]|uniref:Glycerol-3-phosphate acyltransferase 3-like n=1 Tax=Danio rerio TaxID=7955 RepID=GPT3L_DANRE|nr:glycerol-3-phosphate acyltransferase 3-like [Danio rerio]A3KGT9.1 RecName: Full=Glycerol-3-phosphate acyltransferase 3-like; AltName: Full=1-acyl-sn-glycerol-3-phosphate O-acyltransferase 9-like; Short=1-AGP acyltransferase 9-like; Short=1-AGPAT 9-like; AltName: Full=Lysophosphatidic acid acyltransferase theta-like; Short=LPAAT-theta-like [Danio rerio]|eukprot:NP_001092920.1 glycerol-3-phosphate acyltransferase 3-like [Danio rerio]